MTNAAPYSAQNAFAQVAHASYRSTEHWLRQQGLSLLLDAVVIAVLLVVGRWVIGRVDRVVRKFLRDSPRINALLENFLGHALSKVLWLLLLLMVLQRLGIDVGPLLAGFGVTGFIVGFAFQDSLANLASGMMIALNSPFQVGNYVEVAGVGGVVQDVNMMATTLLTPDNKRVVIPNKQVWGSTITNFTAMSTRRVDATVSIAYGADIGKARDVLRQVVAAHPLCLVEPPPAVEVLSLGDSAVNFVVRPWVKTADYWKTLFSLNQAIKEALDESGIPIPFPQLDVHLYDAQGRGPRASSPGPMPTSSPPPTS
jgi:small conductance mechanosensitive channel